MAFRAVRLLRRFSRPVLLPTRNNSSGEGAGEGKRGLVLGCFTGCEGELILSPGAKKFDTSVNGKLTELIKGADIKKRKVHILNDLGSPDFYAVAVTGIGPQDAGFNDTEALNECKENIRVMAAVGASTLQSMAVPNIFVDGVTNPEAAAEGAVLATWCYQDFKEESMRKTEVNFHLYGSDDVTGWERGLKKGYAQNIARTLTEMPPNIITPTSFCQKAIEILCPCGISVEVRDFEWIERQNMKSFLKVAKGSHQEPRFLELFYCGAGPEDKPIVIVGKGITFDSGGLTLRECDGMMEYKADVAGAAVAVGTLKAAAELQLPMNITALIPLCENMPSGSSMKPGDVILGGNGKTVRLRNISKEGRVAISDAVVYSMTYKPCLLLTVGTMSEGIRTALGASSSGAFTTSDSIWEEIKKAGAETGDRVWRLPLWQYFSDRVEAYHDVDIDNVGNARGGDPCVAAAFIKEFVPPIDWLHLDITGVGMWSTGHGYPYLRRGEMTGRPTRTVIQFLNQMACPQEKSSTC